MVDWQHRVGRDISNTNTPEREIYRKFVFAPFSALVQIPYISKFFPPNPKINAPVVCKTPKTILRNQIFSSGDYKFLKEAKKSIHVPYITIYGNNLLRVSAIKNENKIK